MHATLLPFLYLLAAEMLDLDLENLRGFSCTCDFFIHQLLGGVVFHGDLFQQLHGSRAVLYQMAPAKHNGALQVRRPCLVLHGFVSADREAHLVAGLQRVELVPCACAVEIDFLGRFVIKVIEAIPHNSLAA